jgi:hypothetical protein
MNTIKWVNDTFCPWGLTPIEDLPEAVPGQGNSCVLAKVLKDGFPELEDIQVGSTSIDFNVYDDALEEMQNARLKEMLELNENFPMPQEIRDFIREFDYGNIPQLIDEDDTIAMMGEDEAHDTLKIGCTNDKECPFCFPDGEIHGA